jgi:hypothetical protein
LESQTCALVPLGEQNIFYVLQNVKCLCPLVNPFSIFFEIFFTPEKLLAFARTSRMSRNRPSSQKPEMRARSSRWGLCVLLCRFWHRLSGFCEMSLVKYPIQEKAKIILSRADASDRTVDVTSLLGPISNSLSTESNLLSAASNWLGSMQGKVVPRSEHEPKQRELHKC